MKKRFFTKVASLAMVAVLSVTTLFSFNAEAKFSFPVSNAKKVLTVENMAEKAVVADIKDMAKTMTGSSRVMVGEEVSLYNVDTQETFFLYPVQVDGVLTYVAHADMYGDVSITNNLEVYNKINALAGGEYVLYVDNGVYYASAGNKTYELYNEGFDILYDEYSFDDLSFADKVDVMSEDTAATFSEVGGLKLEVASLTVPGTAELNASRGQTVTKKCGITNFLLQGNYGLCWACTVGTIANYKNGTNYTGKNIADMMGIGYNDGATIYEMQQALSRLGLSYSVVTRKPTFAQVKSNINADKPFGMCLSASNAGHAITGYGYSYNTANTSASASTNLVYAWDSNGYQISFKHSASIISTSGYRFTWYGAVM